MPLQQMLPTWVALNNANFPTASGIQDLRTGQDFPAGGLNLGDYFDVTEREANSASFLTNGLCHHGRYRLIHLDSGATAANVKTGTIGFLRSGMFVQGAVITAPGASTVSGTFLVPLPVNSGNGNGAVLSITAVSGTGATAVSVQQGGTGYTQVPTISAVQITAAVPGLTGVTVVCQLNSSPNEIISSDMANAAVPKTLVNPVVFLNAITPGNFGFVQELGLATVLAGGALTANNFVTATPATGLAADGGTSYTNTTVGQSIDAGSANALSKIYLYGPVTQD